MKLGYQALIETLGLNVIQPLPEVAELGSRRSARTGESGETIQTYKTYPEHGDRVASQLAFALKHEIPNLEVLARTFDVWGRKEIPLWLKREPTSQYARRTGFLFEWLTGERLPIVEDRIKGNYQDAIDSNKVIAATKPEQDKRWRINNNLPGTRHFCPIIRRTDFLDLSDGYSIADRIAELGIQYGEDLIRKSAVWLTIKESRASFAIEHEGGQDHRIRRFALAMERFTGSGADLLHQETIETIQNTILGPSLTRPGIRQSPVFIGSGTQEYGTYIHYVAPPASELEPMLEGLREFLSKTRGENPMVRAAVASFGFVYIHPLSDGNGRLSRLLINDVLRRDKSLPSPYILPVSATIANHARSRAQYDETLEIISKPLMAHIMDGVEFGARVKYPDNIESDFRLNNPEVALPVWRYPDLTDHAEYLTETIVATIENNMAPQIAFTAQWHTAREHLKHQIEGPDSDLDRIIRSVRETGAISNKLVKQFPLLADPALQKSITTIILDRAPRDVDENVPFNARAFLEELARELNTDHTPGPT